MICTQRYASPLGGILIAADEQGLTGLWFDNQKYFADTLPKDAVAQSTSILADAARWLDIYFSGREPDFLPPLHPQGSAFRQAVCGRCCCKSPTARPLPTANYPIKSPPSAGLPTCRRKPWAVRWDTTPFPSSFPATGS